MHAFAPNPCIQLNADQLDRMRRAILDVEIAANAQGNPTGLRIFDAYITTHSPTPVNACNGYILTTATHTPKRQEPKPRGWWRRWRER